MDAGKGIGVVTSILRYVLPMLHCTTIYCKGRVRVKKYGRVEYLCIMEPGFVKLWFEDGVGFDFRGIGER